MNYYEFATNYYEQLIKYECMWNFNELKNYNKISMSLLRITTISCDFNWNSYVCIKNFIGIITNSYEFTKNS